MSEHGMTAPTPIPATLNAAVEAGLAAIDAANRGYHVSRGYARSIITAAWPGIADQIAQAHATGTAEGAAAERERIAQAIEATFARWERGEIERPRYERGGFLNDRDWCLAIARAGTSEADHG